MAPLDGRVTDTVGNWFGADLTVTLTPADVRDAPSSSNALAVNVYVPTLAPVHVTAYGAVESEPIRVGPR